MGKQYIDQVVESPYKYQTWEKSPNSWHTNAFSAIYVTGQIKDKRTLTEQSA